MLRILERRFDGLHILLYPAQVQGDDAARQIASGVRYFNNSKAVDVVIVGRGGGSLEDLWAFNEEVVARAIAECEIPVVSAVGHQTDFTIADFVADLRAPTPSAAAELVVRKKEEFTEAVGNLRARLARAVRYKLATAGRDILINRAERAGGLVRHGIASRSQRVDELTFSLRDSTVNRLPRRGTENYAGSEDRLKHLDLRVGLQRHRARLDHAGGRIAQLATLRLERRRTRLESLRKQLAQLSPVSILDRGYAIVQAADGSLIRMAEAGPETAIRWIFACTVDSSG